MKLMKIIAAAALALSIAGCARISLPALPSFGAAQVQPAVADSYPDGSLASGHGKPAQRAPGPSAGDREAEKRGIKADAPYGVR